MAKNYQQTFNVDGHKITVVIKTRTSLGNLAGYAATVTDNKGSRMDIPMINKLYPQEAQEIAYTRFVQKYC